MKKKILFNGLGNRGWIGGLYYIKNIMFSCLQNENIMERFSLVLLIDPEHADIFDCFKDNPNVDIRVYDGNNKIKLALYEMRLIWFGGVKYCYALELNKIGKLLKRREFSGFLTSSTGPCRNFLAQRNWLTKRKMILP